MISHGISLVTKGFLNSSSVTLMTKGYEVVITVEDVSDITSSGGVAQLKPPVNKKLMKVTVKVKGETFTETQLVDKSVKLVAKDVNVVFNDGKPRIKVNNVNLKDPWFGQTAEK